MGNLLKFEQDSFDGMDADEFDSLCDGYFSTDTFTVEDTKIENQPTLNEDGSLGCGSNSCSYCSGNGYYWSCGENVTCSRCGGSGIGD